MLSRLRLRFVPEQRKSQTGNVLAMESQPSATTQKAIAAIGADAPTDWQLNVELHSESLGSNARLLKQILNAPQFAEIVSTFRSADDAAKSAQKFYKRLARLSAWTGFGAALFGSLVLMAASALAVGSLLTAAAALQAVLLIVSLGSSLLIGSLQPFEAWMLKRAEAENARASLFDQVMAARGPTDREDRILLPLQLEYFRRYQLDVQRLYYQQRGAQHAAAARKAWWWRLVAFLLVLFAAFPVLWSIQGSLTVPAPLQDFINGMPQRTETMQRAFLGIGIIAASLQGLLAAFAVMSLDERNAARYRSTAENLDALAARPLDEARAAAAVASEDSGATHVARERVLAFIALAQEQISAEHREWIALRKLAPDLALDRLKSLRLPPRS